MPLIDKVEVLYEDNDLVVVSKPAGLIVHSDGERVEESLVDWVKGNYPEVASVGEPLTLSDGRVVERSGIVHRIDKETTGALVIAKSQRAFESIKKQFQEREVEKTYHAFAWGVVKDDEGTINRSIGRSRKDFRQWSAQRGARGEMREAVTDYKVLRRGTDFTFLELRPRTGRTHQIRVHMKAVNHPLVGDTLYAPKRSKALGFDRLALHAYKLKFHNLNGEIVEVSCPYPEDFKRAIKKI